MGRQNIIQQEEKPPNPLLPIIGFVLFLVVGGAAFLASPRMVTWLKTTHFKLGGFIPLLPMEFPKGWSPLANQLAVTLFLSILFFTIVMACLFFLMKPPGTGETDVSLDQIRREKQKMMRRR